MGGNAEKGDQKNWVLRHSCPHTWVQSRFC